MLGDRILSVSAAAAEPFMAGPLPVECIPNGIDLDDWKARGAGVAGAALRTELGLAHDTPIVANVARVSSEKDQVTFVEACAAIRAHRPDVHYAIIGETRTDAKAVREVRAAIATHQLGNRLHLLGERHDLPALYPQFDVMLLTSRHEGFANVLMEAMASGVPVVSTMSGGPQSIIRDQVDGLLVPVGDAAALADAAMLCLSEQETVQRMTDSALRRVKEEFDWPVIVRRITDFYRRTIAERHQVRGGHEHGLMVLLEIIAEAAQRDAARAKILERLCCGPSKGRMHRLGAAAMGALRRTVKLGKGLN